jgi:hypothetical protein
LAFNGFDFAMITKFHASLLMKEGEFFEGKWDRVVMAMPSMRLKPILQLLYSF